MLKKPSRRPPFTRSARQPLTYDFFRFLRRPLHGRLHALVFTQTPVEVRVISFRKANRREVLRYEQATQP